MLCFLFSLCSSSQLTSRLCLYLDEFSCRTFPEHEYFESGRGCGLLRRVLRAFAMFRPDIGYCQSLNFLAGTMLLFMDEEDAFWLLATVVSTLLPADYYSRSMVGTHVDQYVLSMLLKKGLPRLHG